MKIISTTKFRETLSDTIDEVGFKKQPIGIGRRQRIDALLIKFPANVNPYINDVTHFNAESGGFDFLEHEPDIYSVDDLKKKDV